MSQNVANDAYKRLAEAENAVNDIYEKLEEIEGRVKELDSRFEKDLNNHKGLTKQRFTCVQKRIVRMERNVHFVVYAAVAALILSVVAYVMTVV